MIKRIALFALHLLILFMLVGCGFDNQSIDTETIPHLTLMLKMGEAFDEYRKSLFSRYNLQYGNHEIRLVVSNKDTLASRTNIYIDAIEIT